MAKHVPVTFENSLGETISNDPIFLAQRTLEAAGVTSGAERPGDHEDYMPTDYDDMDSKELKALSLERGVDIKGLKTVGQVRAALVAADDAEAAAAAATAADDEE